MTAAYLVSLFVMMAFIGLVVQKCKANNAKVFDDAVQRTASIEVMRRADREEYNRKLGELQSLNEDLLAFIQANLPVEVRDQHPV